MTTLKANCERARSLAAWLEGLRAAYVGAVLYLWVDGAVRTWVDAAEDADMKRTVSLGWAIHIFTA